MIKFLCPNIPNHEGMKTAKEALTFENKRLIETKIIIRFSLLILILTLNNFIFNGFHYLQKMGCVVGKYALQTILMYLWQNLYWTLLIRHFLFSCIGGLLYR